MDIYLKKQVAILLILSFTLFLSSCIIPFKTRSHMRLCYSNLTDYSSSLNINRIYTIQHNLTKLGQSEFKGIDQMMLFKDGLVVMNPFTPDNKIVHLRDPKSTCESFSLITQKQLKNFYHDGAWGLFKISNDTLVVQVFNGNVRYMLSDFYSLSTYKFKLITFDSLQLVSMIHHDNKSGWKLKSSNVTSVVCNHHLTSGTAWVKREKWLYCNNK